MADTASLSDLLHTAADEVGGGSFQARAPKGGRKFTKQVASSLSQSFQASNNLLLRGVASLLEKAGAQEKLLRDIDETLKSTQTNTKRFQDLSLEQFELDREQRERDAESYRPKTSVLGLSDEFGEKQVTLLESIEKKLGAYGKNVSEGMSDSSNFFVKMFGPKILETVGSWIAAAGGLTTILTTLGVGAAVAGIGWTIKNLFDSAAKSHEILEGYKKEGRTGIAFDEAKALGIETTGRSTEEVKMAVANQFQTTGQISDDDWKKMGVKKHAAGQGFTPEEADKLLEYRQSQRAEQQNKQYTGGKGFAFAGVTASMVRPARVSAQPTSTPAKTTPMQAMAAQSLGQPVARPTGTTIAGSGFTDEEGSESLSEARERVSVPTVSTSTSTPTKMASSGMGQALGSFGEYGDADKFVKEMYPHAERASKALGGVDPQALLAQWGAESGWGSKVTGSYNYFGIKAHSSWKGKSRIASTHENINGRNVPVKAAFREYNSVSEAVDDYVQFLKKNPRYKKAGLFKTKTAPEYFTALQNAGYATDPNYAATLTNIATKSVAPRVTQLARTGELRTAAPVSTATAQVAAAQAAAPVVLAPSVVASMQPVITTGGSTTPMPVPIRTRDESVAAITQIGAI